MLHPDEASGFKAIGWARLRFTPAPFGIQQELPEPEQEHLFVPTEHETQDQREYQEANIILDIIDYQTDQLLVVVRM